MLVIVAVTVSTAAAALVVVTVTAAQDRVGRTPVLFLGEIVRSQQEGAPSHIGKPVPDRWMASTALHVVDGRCYHRGNVVGQVVKVGISDPDQGHSHNGHGRDPGLAVGDIVEGRGHGPDGQDKIERQRVTELIQQCEPGWTQLQQSQEWQHDGHQRQEGAIQSA